MNLKKIIKNFLLFLLMVIFIIASLDIISISNYPSTRAEARCRTIGSIERYHELLKYNEFEKTADSLVNYEILQDNLHIYNNECKDFNESEEILIDEIFKKATQKKRHRGKESKI